MTGYGLLVLVKIALLAAPVPLWLRWRRRGSSGASVSIAHRVRWFAFTAMALAPSLLLDAWTPVVRVNPLWPISWTTSLDVIAADSVTRIQLLRSLYWLAPAGLLLIVSTLFRFRMQRLWWVGLALSVMAIWWKWPDLSPLVVPAYPTTYFSRPPDSRPPRSHVAGRFTAITARGVTVATGAAMARRHASLPRPPADLTARHLWMHADGELFWWISHGIDGQDGIKLMPGFDRQPR